MFAFSVLLFGPLLVQAIQLGEPSGLNFDVNQEYATSYENYKPSNYKFEYGVSDPHTGDHKSHWEVKENVVVRGEYRLLEPDGTTRIVQYTADDHNGFRATIKKIGHAIHPSNVHHSSVVQEIPDQPELHHSYDSGQFFKTYDGSEENYVNTLPIQVPYHESVQQQDHQLSLRPSDILSSEITLPNPVTDNHELSRIASINVLQEEPNSIPSHLPLPINVLQEERNIIPSHLPLQKLNHINATPAEIINNQEYGYIKEPTYQPYIPENAPLASSKYILPLLLNQEQVLSSPQISETHENSPFSIQVHNNIAYPEKVFLGYSPMVMPLYIGMRIDHPHGESSSSFRGTSGNTEDDSAYTSYGGGGANVGW